MNEGYSALLTLALLAEQAPNAGWRAPRFKTAARCMSIAFSRHTRRLRQATTDLRLISCAQFLGDQFVVALEAAGCIGEGELNMTELALRFSRCVNGVAMRHSEVTRQMFPTNIINAVTNGVHAVTWATPSTARLFDRHIPEWRKDNLYLRYAVSIPLDEIRQAHSESKSALLAEVAHKSAARLRLDALTIGFARRATAYKRADLLFPDLEWLGFVR